MNHEERYNNARAICRKIRDKLSDQLVTAGIIGSLARGDDTEHSDIDLDIVVKEGTVFSLATFFLNGIVVDPHVIHEDRLRALLSDAGSSWPAFMGVLDVLKVLEGDKNKVEEWQQLGRAVPIERFRDFLRANLPRFVFESYGRVLSCESRRNDEPLGISAIEIVNEMNVVLCLLNQRWVTHKHYDGVRDACSFSKLPHDYARLSHALYFESNPSSKIAAARALFANYLELLEAEGFKVHDMSSANSLTL